MGVQTAGWYIIGIDPCARTAQGVVENYTTMGLSSEAVRIWRDFPDRPDLEGLPRATQLCRHFETDYPPAVGLQFYVIHTEDPDSPVAIDWSSMLREYRRKKPRYIRGRVDRFHRTNPKFVTRGVWEPLIY